MSTQPESINTVNPARTAIAISFFIIFFLFLSFGVFGVNPKCSDYVNSIYCAKYIDNGVNPYLLYPPQARCRVKPHIQVGLNPISNLSQGIILYIADPDYTGKKGFAMRG